MLSRMIFSEVPFRVVQQSVIDETAKWLAEIEKTLNLSFTYVGGCGNCQIVMAANESIRHCFKCGRIVPNLTATSIRLSAPVADHTKMS